MVRMTVLASGSRGNSAVVSSSGTSILLDAGLSCKETLRRMHAAGDDALQRAPRRIGRLAQFNQLSAEFIEQAGKSTHRGLIGGTHVALPALRLDDQIDRTVLQMQPLAVRQKRDLRKPLHARRPGM